MLAVAEGRRIRRARIGDPRAEERAIHVLTSVLPHAVDHTAVAGAVHGALTGPERGGALAGIPLGVEWALRARYCGTDRYRLYAADWVRAATIRISHAKGWGKTDHDRKMVIAAIVFADLFPAVCDICKGRKEIPCDRGISEECPSCGGIGRMMNDGLAKAQMMGCALQTWRNHWSRRANAVYRDCEGRMSDAISIISGNSI